MPKPLSRRNLIIKLKSLGFFGPFSGGKHEYMERNGLNIVIPNPHKKDISGELVQRIFRQIETRT
ncbi:MAG: type II toxin-antitoxin system HicA family toxin [Candidatus Vogelbacteria bacterium]|nr:type II toxin-antitoxin system HicA family toxin [Candidatus Vogelbacteria bacterium]